jgi:hypothetical protein
MPLELIAILSVLIIPLIILLIMKVIDIIIEWVIITVANSSIINTLFSKDEK